jgi:hypothetical protein
MGNNMGDITGSIIVGYQGIGKSSLGGTERYIDLESSSFFVSGQRDENWAVVYADIAWRLAEQGYDVFVSSHQAVRDMVRSCYSVRRIIVYPAVELKDEWIKKLKRRYIISHLEKDYKALMNADDRYVENIKEMMAEFGFAQVAIEDMDYSLAELLTAKKKQMDEIVSLKD